MSEPLELEPRRRRGCGCLAGLISLVLLLGVAAVLDEVARRYAENRGATAVQAMLGTADRPSVTLGGWPFTAALVTNRLQSFTITDPQVHLTRNNTAVTVTDVQAVGTGVHDPLHLSRAVADDLTLSGAISWAELSRLAGQTISYAGDGRVKFTGKVSAFGQTVKVDATAVPGIDAATQKFTLTEPRATVDGVDVPASMLQPLADQLASRATLPVQADMTYRSLTPSATGVRVVLHGTSVPLSSLG